MTYRTGNQSPINIWLHREGRTERQVFMARTDYEAAELVRLANLGAHLEAISRDDLAKAIETDYLGDTTDAVATLIGLDGQSDVPVEGDCPPPPHPEQP